MPYSVANRLKAFFMTQRVNRERQELLKEARAQVLRDVDVMRGLLKDPRYERYVQLLRDAQQAFEAERSGYLRTAERSDDHALKIARLTGKLEMIDNLLAHPERLEDLATSLVEQAESPMEADDTASHAATGRSPAR